jgi:hypothetical protein
LLDVDVESDGRVMRLKTPDSLTRLEPRSGNTLGLDYVRPPYEALWMIGASGAHMIMLSAASLEELDVLCRELLAVKIPEGQFCSDEGGWCALHATPRYRWYGVIAVLVTDDLTHPSLKTVVFVGGGRLDDFAGEWGICIPLDECANERFQFATNHYLRSEIVHVGPDGVPSDVARAKRGQQVVCVEGDREGFLNALWHAGGVTAEKRKDDADAIAAAVKKGRDSGEDIVTGTFLELWIAAARVAAAVLGLLNCRNVVVETISPDQNLQRARRKRGHAPLYQYHVLKVRVGGTVVRGQSRGGHLEDLVLHWVRGHFKHYTAEAPLFGRMTGTWWWSPTLKGDAAHGVVDKEYQIEMGPA